MRGRLGFNDDMGTSIRTNYLVVVIAAALPVLVALYRYFSVVFFSDGHISHSVMFCMFSSLDQITTHLSHLNPCQSWQQGWRRLAAARVIHDT